MTSARTAEITISWHDVSSNETGFRVEVRQGDGPWLLLRLTTANVTSVTHPGVLFGETYWYRVAACNAAGCSEWVETSGKWQTGGPPEVVSFRTGGIGAETAVLLASASSGGLPTRFTFIVYEKTALFVPVVFSPAITKTPSNVGGEVTGSVAVDFIVFGLKPDTEYRASLHVENDIGSALTVVPVEFKTVTAAAPQFTELRTTSTAPGRIFTAATVYPGGLFTTWRFEIVRDGSSFDNPIATFTGSTSPASRSASASASFPNLQSGETYRWRIVGENKSGRTLSGEATYTVP